MYAEIDPEFIRNHSDELRKSWTMLNNQGVHQKVIFNQVGDHPIIISGCQFLEAYYNLPSEVVIEVGYYGNNNFGIIRFKELSKWDNLPNFHSRYVFDDDIHAFNVTLSPITASLPKLVEYW
ncbi:hypothetical protein RYX36_024173 [Vicia faba]